MNITRNKNGKILFAILGMACAVLRSFAGDYYVSTTGVDAEGRGTTDTAPFKTIAYALGVAKTSGDVVHVAAGTYYEGDLVVKAGVGVVATDGRDETTIDAQGSSANQRRCFKTLNAKSYIKGFMVKNGYAPSASEKTGGNGGGVVANANAAIIDCAFYGCSGYRGGAGNGGVWIRCYLASDNKAYWSDLANGIYGPSFVANCYFAAGCATDSTGKKIVNSTFTTSAKTGGNMAANEPYCYNSLLYYVQNGAYLYNTCVTHNNATDTQVCFYDADCKFKPAASTVALGTDKAPKAGASNLVGKGKYADYYAAFFPEDWKTIGEWDKDFNGKSRVRGDNEMDIGACQSDYAATLYVNVEKGSDDNDGCTTNAPFKTIFQAMSRIAEGGTIHCAAGDYNWENQKLVDDANGTNVVHFTRANVKLVADEGREKTFISGRKQTPGGIRCVNARYTGSVIQGFTIRQGGGFVSGDVDGNYGYGIYSYMSSADLVYATAIDCRFTDFASCTTGRGPATYCVDLVRCVIDAGISDRNFCACQCGNAYNSVFFSTHYLFGGCRQVNCTNIGTMPRSNGSRATSPVNTSCLYNTLIYGNTSSHANGDNHCYTNCYITGPIYRADMADASTKYNQGTAKVALDTATGVVGAGSVTINAGDNAYTNQIPAAYRDLDGYGHARVIYNTIDIGAYEFTWAGVTGVGFSYVVVDRGEELSDITVTPVHDSEKFCSGFTFNGKAYVFDGLNPITTDDPVSGDPMTVFAPTYSTVTNWYVSPTGNDTNYGYAADVPLKTFKTAMSKASSGHVVHALAGTYDDGLMDVAEGTTNRVVIKAGVGLVADEGPEKTFIVGHKSSSDGGVGSDAVRCVCLKDSASYIRGFTLTGGAAVKASDWSNCGGGVTGSGAAIDCIITNNVAQRGGGAHSATCIRCRFKDNASISYGVDGYNGIYVDCVSDGGGFYTSGLVLNCSAYRKADDNNSGLVYAPSAGAMTINTLLYDGFNHSRIFSNCVFVANTSQKNLYECKKGQSEADCGNHDEEYRTLTAPGTSVLTDKGWLDAYNAHFPKAWEQFKTYTDCVGGQRVYNAAIDIGAGEYDWRPTYATRLSKRKNVEVVSATSGVTGGTTCVNLQSGDCLVADWTISETGEQSLQVSGSATVTLDGKSIVGSAGLYTFEAEAGDAVRIVITAGADGVAVSSFRGPRHGMAVLMR